MEVKDIRRKRLTVAEKLLILKDLDDNMSYSQIGIKYNVSKSAVCLIKKDRDMILEFDKNSKNKNMKRIKFRSDTGSLIDEKVYHYYMANSNDKNAVTGKMLQREALRVASDIGDENFKGSNGWLHNFQNRHGIKFKPGYGPPNASINFQGNEDDKGEDFDDNRDGINVNISGNNDLDRLASLSTRFLSPNQFAGINRIDGNESSAGSNLPNGNTRDLALEELYAKFNTFKRAYDKVVDIDLDIDEHVVAIDNILKDKLGPSGSNKRARSNKATSDANKIVMV